MAGTVSRDCRPLFSFFPLQYLLGLLSLSLPSLPASFFRFSFSFRLQFLARAGNEADWMIPPTRLTRYSLRPPFFFFFFSVPFRFNTFLMLDGVYPPVCSACVRKFLSRFLPCFPRIGDLWDNKPIEWRCEMGRENLKNSELELASSWLE